MTGSIWDLGFLKAFEHVFKGEAFGDFDFLYF